MTEAVCSELAGITNGTLSSSWIDQARSGSTCAGHTTSKRDAYETASGRGRAPGFLGRRRRGAGACRSD
jgi:hypothetical protein